MTSEARRPSKDMATKVTKVIKSAARTSSRDLGRMKIGSKARWESENRPFYKVYVDTHLPQMVQFVDSIAFEHTIGMVIMLNCVTIGLEAHLCPPAESPRSRDTCPEMFMFAAEHVCTAVFVLEFFLRGIFLGFNYHVGSWDRILDAFLVWVTGVLVNWILPFLEFETGTLKMLTALRACRLMRLIHLVRFEPAFRNCWLLFRGLYSSSSTLSATVGVILFLNYLFGIWAVVIIGDSDAFGEDADAAAAQTYFHGLDQTLFTMMQILTGDSWASGIARPIMKIMPYAWIFFLAYIAIAVIVLMNLVTAVIVENAMETSRGDREERLQMVEAEREEVIRLLHEIFRAIDTDKSGFIEENEFQELIESNTEVLLKLKLVGFDDDDMPALFHDLDDGDGLLNLHEFTKNLNAMKGWAKSADMLRLSKLVQRVHARLDAVFDIIDPKKTVSDKHRQFTARPRFSLLKRSSTTNLERHTTTDSNLEEEGSLIITSAIQVEPGSPAADAALPSFNGTALADLEERMQQRLENMEQRMTQKLNGAVAQICNILEKKKYSL